MAVVNQYKFYGKATTAAETVSMLSPAVNETFIPWASPTTII